MRILDYFHPEVIAFLVRAYSRAVVEDIIEYIEEIKGYDVGRIARPEKWFLSMLINQEEWLWEHSEEVPEQKIE